MLRTARIALPILSLLLLAAHFYRTGLYPLVAVSLAMVALPFLGQPWTGRVLQVALTLGSAEWLRTAWEIASRRAALGQSYGRLLVILGAVAVVTLAAAFLARSDRRVSRAPGTD